MIISAIQKKELIVSATISLINEFGIQSFSTRELARRLGMAEGTIFNYFPKKTDLIIAALDQFSQYDNDIFSTVKMRNFDPLESISFYANSYSIFYENYPEITSLFQAFDLTYSDEKITNKVKGIYSRRLNFIKLSVEEAQLSKRIRSEHDSDILSCIIISSLRGICLQWKLEDYKFSLCERTKMMMNILFKSFE